MIPLFRTTMHQESIDNAIRVMQSGWLGLGPETEAFEKEFATYLGAKYAIATNSGTEALRLAVHIASRQTKRGYAVTTPNTFISTNAVLLQNDMHPVFTDIQYTTGSMLFVDTETALQNYSCGLLMIVHYGGYPVDIERFEELANIHKVDMVWDCAHACGTIYKGRKVGSWGRYNCFSFHAVKNLAIGEGGMLVTDDEEIATKAKQLRWLGIDKSTYQRSQDTYGWEYTVKDVGYKSHMWDLQAAIGRGQLKHLDDDNEKREALAARYRKNLHSNNYPRYLDIPLYNSSSSNHLFVALFSSRESRHRAIEELTTQGIQYGYHYTPNYKYDYYRDFPTLGTKNMEKFYNTALTLPMNLSLTEEQVDQICDIIQE